MKNKTIGARVFESLIILLGVSSFLVMVHGTIHQDWWAGLGLIVLAPSILCWISIFHGARKAQSEI